LTQYEKDILNGRVAPEVLPDHTQMSFKEQLAYRTENREWLRESFLIGLQILEALDAKGWKQKDLAEALNVSPQMVNKYLSGKCEFGLPIKHKLQTALGIKLGEAYYHPEPLEAYDDSINCVVRPINSSTVAIPQEGGYNETNYTHDNEKRSAQS
jgi:transcriptional regulator with XRE-family HTH domain